MENRGYLVGAVLILLAALVFSGFSGGGSGMFWERSQYGSPASVYNQAYTLSQACHDQHVSALERHAEEYGDCMRSAQESGLYYKRCKDDFDRARYLSMSVYADCSSQIMSNKGYI